MAVLAIIPARGGSKGIPRKNLAECAGNPLLQWTIDAALSSLQVDSVVVSSDDNDILQYAWEQGANLINRPKEYATDNATTESVIEHTLARFNDFDTIVLLQPTSPVRTWVQIDEAIEMFHRGGYDTLLSVVKSHAFQWDTSNGQRNYDIWERPRRQELDNWAEENGSIYIFSMGWWKANKNRLGGEIGFYFMPEESRIQIDTPLDLYLVGKILERQYA